MLLRNGCFFFDVNAINLGLLKKQKKMKFKKDLLPRSFISERKEVCYHSPLTDVVYRRWEDEW